MSIYWNHITKIVHITHTDLDGIGCRIVASKVADTVKRDYEVHHVNYGGVKDLLLKVIPTLKESHLLLITDLNLSYEEAEIANQHKKIRLYDHHNTEVGKELARKFSWYYLEDGKSATRILFEKVFADIGTPIEVQNYSSFSSFVNAYDVYKRNDIHEFEIGRFFNDEISEIMGKLPTYFEEAQYDIGAAYIEDVLLFNIDRFRTISEGIKDGHITSTDFFTFDSLINLRKQEFLRFYLKRKGFVHFSSHTALIKYLDSLFNKDDYLFIDKDGYLVFVVWDIPRTAIMGIADLNMYELKNFHAMISINTKYGTASFRSVHDTIDVSAIARLFGGNGHINAAGTKNELFKLDGKFPTHSQKKDAINQIMSII